MALINIPDSFLATITTAQEKLRQHYGTAPSIEHLVTFTVAGVTANDLCRRFRDAAEGRAPSDPAEDPDFPDNQG